MSEENSVVIEDPQEESQEVVAVESAEEAGLTEKEFENAKELGIVKQKGAEDGEHEGKQENEAEEGQEADEEGVLDLETLDSFEAVHDIFEKEPEKFRSLPRHVKALYHNSKGLYKKAKVEEQKRQEIEKATEFQKIKNKGAEAKLKKVNELLSKEDLTVEDIKAVLDHQEQQPEEPQKSSDDEAVKIQQRYLEAEKAGRAEHENWDEIVQMAAEITTKRPHYQRMLQGILFSEDSNDQEFIDELVNIAKMNPKFSGKTPKTDKVERIKKNAQKRTSSAAIGGGNGKRTVSYDDLTPEDVLNMSQEQFNKLPKNVVERLGREL